MSLSADQALELAALPRGMNAEQTTQVLELLVSGALDIAPGAEILQIWAARSETGIELAAAATFLRQRAVTVPLAQACFDSCGTGGSGLTRYNVSTTVAFVAAAAGVPVAKHGNRGSRRPNGSFDLLDALQIPFELAGADAASLQKKSGVCFLFARTHHPEVARVVPYRKAAACRSIFNLAGPLANPASIKHQIIGTVNEATARVVGEALTVLRSPGALVVWGEPGIDEISVTGKTGYIHIQEDKMRAGVFDAPQHPGLDYAALSGGDAPENALIFQRLLLGDETGPLLDMVCENAGAAIDLWEGRAPAYGGRGAKQARELLESRAVQQVFEIHRKMAQEMRERAEA